MEDLSMFQRPRIFALEDEKPGTYGIVLICPLNRLVECGFVGDTAVNPWVEIVCRRQAFARESVVLPTRPIGRVWLRGLHAKHLYLGISGVYGDTRNPGLILLRRLGRSAHHRSWVPDYPIGPRTDPITLVQYPMGNRA
ncbi:hypothetical protein PIB30_044645 [Stylosanthes scabra]|uniref:Uncharacterized protein n=1 Tax=Stylosanthes scabra TaxID=79078 RepID=A0ABU6WE63_9FABA|nr:hypothetical protein [Stylosanthes scabra]